MTPGCLGMGMGFLSCQEVAGQGCRRAWGRGHVPGGEGRSRALAAQGSGSEGGKACASEAI